MYFSQCRDKSKVFLRRNTLDKLEALRSGVLSRSAVVVQRIVRGALTRVYCAAMKDEMKGAAVVLQRAARNQARRRYYLGRDRVAARGWMIRTWYAGHPKTVKMRSFIPYREFEGMERDIETMKLERIAFEATADATRSELLSLRSELDDTRRSAECVRSELKSRLREYETNAEQLEAESKVSNDTIGRLKAEASALRLSREENDSLKTCQAESIRKVESLTDELEQEARASTALQTELQETRDSAEKVRTALNKELESSKDELRVLKTSITDELKSRQENLSLARFQNGSLAHECSSLKQTNAIMESRLKSVRENFEPLQSREDQTMEDMIHTIQSECSLLISKSHLAQEENLAMARRLLTTQGQSAALECEVEKLSREASKYSQAFYTIASDTEKVVGVVAEGDHCNKIEVNRDLETGFEVSMI